MKTCSIAGGERAGRRRDDLDGFGKPVIKWGSSWSLGRLTADSLCEKSGTGMRGEKPWAWRKESKKLLVLIPFSRKKRRDILLKDPSRPFAGRILFPAKKPNFLPVSERQGFLCAG